MRIGIGGLYHETHSFATPATRLADFDWYQGAAILNTYRGTRTELGGIIDEAGTEAGLVPLLYATTLPSGPVEREAFDAIAAALAEEIRREQPDGLCLVLHGALSVQGLPDAEAHLLERVRAVFGQRPLAVTVDFHANLSHKVVELTDVVVGYKTYPHVDPYERAREAYALLDRMLRGEVRPVSHLEKPPLLTVPPAQRTDSSPMRELMGRAREMERDPRVLSATVTGGFPYADEERAGMGCLVITDGDPGLARRLAEELRELAWENRHSFAVSYSSPAEAVRQAVAFEGGAVALVDVADNVGGGTPADGTALLAELLAAGARDALVTIRDAEAVAHAFSVGEGGIFSFSVGGKTDAFHGAPVPVNGKVLRLAEDGRWRYIGAYMTGQPCDMGRAALVRSGGVDLVITERRITPMDRGYLERLAVDRGAYRIHVVKGAIAWQTGFGDLVKGQIYVDGPGICTVHLDQLPFRHLRRPVFPIDSI